MTRRPPSRTTNSGEVRAASKPSRKPKNATPAQARRRPASAQSAPAPAPAPEQDKPPRQFTVRTLVLALTLLVGFTFITPTLRAYVRQQEELRQVKADLTAAQEQSAELTEAINRWNNDEYVRTQARDRLGFVMPGETPYRVLDPETITGEPSEPEPELISSIIDGTGPWYLDVWESVQVAGEMEP